MAVYILTYHHLSSGWFYFSMFIFFVGCKCSAMDLQPLQIVINEAIAESLALAKVTVKEAASICGMSEPNFYRAISGERYRSLSLASLMKLPYRFWLHFGPQIMWLVAKKHAQEIAETIGLRRSA